jgi:DNA-directed RNA polymerase subunit alpha
MNKEALLDQLALEILRLSPHTFVRSYDLAAQMLERRGYVIEQWTLRDANADVYIANLELSARARSCLEAESIRTVSQLIRCTENDLLKVPNLGRRSLNEIKEKLAEQGLKLLGQA